MTGNDESDAISSGDPDKRLRLEGAVNFRDLGGYATEDGRRVRRRQLFRSDSLAELTAADAAAVAGLGLRSVFDLRDVGERRRYPNHAEAVAGLRVHEVGFLPHRADEMFAGVRDGTLSAAGVGTAIREMYRRLPLEQGAVYASILDGLLEADAVPALIHCTSGKDRTGFAAAVVLSALGVPRASILEDYLLTNHYRRDLSFMLGGDVDPAVVSALTEAHPDYLAAALDAADAEWGSIEGFLEHGLGLTPARRARLQALLLDD